MDNDREAAISLYASARVLGLVYELMIYGIEKERILEVMKATCESAEKCIQKVQEEYKRKVEQDDNTRN